MANDTSFHVRPMAVDEIEWDMTTLPIEQTPMWGKFQDSLSDRRHLGMFGIFDGNQLAGLADAVEIDMGRYRYVWTKNGPVLRDGVASSIDAIIDVLQDSLKRALTTPNLALRFHSKVKPAVARPTFSYQLKKTIILETRPSIDDFVGTVKDRKKRYLMRKTMQDVGHSVSWTDSTKTGWENDLKVFYNLLRSTSERSNFGIHTHEYLGKMLAGLGKHARLYLDTINGRAVAGVIVTYWGSTATYYYAASNQTGLERNAPMRLQLEIIKDMHGAGATRYDLLGVSDKPGDRLDQVTTFKRKFSDSVTEYPGVYDYVWQPLKYQALAIAKKLL